MKDAFLNFSSEDYINGACLTIDNAKSHFLAAETLDIQSLYGIGISLLILASEEYIKSLMLLNLSGDDNFLDVKEKEDLFKNHKFKHKNIAELFRSISNSAAEEFETGFFERLVNNSDALTKFSLDGYYMNKVFKQVSLTDNDCKIVINWLANANEMKNQGFYLGVADNWETPARFTVIEFKEAHRIVKILKDAIEPLFSLPLDDHQLLDYFNSRNIIN